MVSSLGLGLKSTEEELALTFWDTNSYLPSPPSPSPWGREWDDKLALPSINFFYFPKSLSMSTIKREGKQWTYI